MLNSGRDVESPDSEIEADRSVEISGMLVLRGMSGVVVGKSTDVLVTEGKERLVLVIEIGSVVCESSSGDDTVSVVGNDSGIESVTKVVDGVESPKVSVSDVRLSVG